MSVFNEITKLLVVVKAYPNKSNKYQETVCTAGVDKNGNFYRIYPINFRKLKKEEKFAKYQWIEADFIKDAQDPRPESYKLNCSIKLGKKIGTENSWSKRKNLILRRVYTDLEELIKIARDVRYFKSLAVFKPTKIRAFRMKKSAKYQAAGKFDLEVPEHDLYYTFEDENGKLSSLKIIDWEVLELYRKLNKRFKGDFSQVKTILKRKLFDELACGKDLHFILGTNKIWHIRRSKNPFMIIGIFYPPKITD